MGGAHTADCADSESDEQRQRAEAIRKPGERPRKRGTIRVNPARRAPQLTWTGSQMCGQLLWTSRSTVAASRGGAERTIGAAGTINSIVASERSGLGALGGRNDDRVVVRVVELDGRLG